MAFVNDDSVEIEFDRLVSETDMAFLIEIGEGFDAEQYWMPKQKVDMGEDETFMLVPEWLAIEKGLV